jgi:predicted AlkP superfamily phosphohydrolase/phosphomutase
VDWSRTLAYSMGHVGQVYLNVIGRDDHGIILPENVAQRRQEVIDILQDLTDDHGRPLVTDIITGDTAYHGPYAKNGPDLHLVLDEYNMIACPMFATEGKILTSQIRGDSGCHRSEGIFLGQGPALRQGVTLDENNILDLAPTIMHLLGEAVPAVMDGRVLSEIFAAPQPITYDESDTADLSDQQGYDAEEAAQVEERLRGLGYL